MAPPVTEITLLPLATGAAVDNPNTADGQLWRAVLRTLLSREGCKRAYWGREIEDPSMLRLFVDWDSIEHHWHFMAEPAYQSFSKHVRTLLKGQPTLYHAHFVPHPPRAALSDTNSPVTETITAYFPLDYTAMDQDVVTASIRHLAMVIERNASGPGGGYRGFAGGWVVEDVDRASVPGGRARAYVAAIGWDSVEKHAAFRATQAFRDSAHLLQKLPLLLDLQMVHARLTEVQAPAVGQEHAFPGAQPVGLNNGEAFRVRGNDGRWARTTELYHREPERDRPRTRADGPTSKHRRRGMGMY